MSNAKEMFEKQSAALSAIILEQLELAILNNMSCIFMVYDAHGKLVSDINVGLTESKQPLPRRAEIVAKAYSAVAVAIHLGANLDDRIPDFGETINDKQMFEVIRTYFCDSPGGRFVIEDIGCQMGYEIKLTRGAKDLSLN